MFSPFADGRTPSNDLIVRMWQHPYEACEGALGRAEGRAELGWGLGDGTSRQIVREALARLLERVRERGRETFEGGLERALEQVDTADDRFLLISGREEVLAFLGALKLSERSGVREGFRKLGCFGAACGVAAGAVMGLGGVYFGVTNAFDALNAFLFELSLLPFLKESGQTLGSFLASFLGIAVSIKSSYWGSQLIPSSEEVARIGNAQEYVDRIGERAIEGTASADVTYFSVTKEVDPESAAIRFILEKSRFDPEDVRLIVFRDEGVL